MAAKPCDKFLKINKCDVNNGPGVRVSVFFSGCFFHCEGCWNAKSWNPNLGEEFTKETLDEIVTEVGKSYIDGLSLLGGEPFMHGKTVLDLVKRIKKAYPEKTIWIWSGYTLDELLTNPLFSEILSYCDVLVDGQFVLQKRDLTQAYCGSTNQRVINLRNYLPSYLDNECRDNPKIVEHINDVTPGNCENFLGFPQSDYKARRENSKGIQNYQYSNSLKE